MTRLFGNKKDKTTIAELEEYYANQDQKKTRTWKAWLMAILSIIITIAIIVALFFGGRWLYRTLTDDSSDSATTTQGGSNGEVNLPAIDGDIVGQGNQTNGNDAENSNSNSNSNSTPTPESGGVVTDEAATTSEASVGSVSGSTNTGGDEPLPDTGAGELLIVIPFVTAIAGYYISRRNYSKQN